MGRRLYISKYFSAVFQYEEDGDTLVIRISEVVRISTAIEYIKSEKKC